MLFSLNISPGSLLTRRTKDFIALLQFLFSMDIIGPNTADYSRNIDHKLYFKITQTFENQGGQPKIYNSEGKTLGFTITLRQKKKVQTKIYTNWVFSQDFLLNLTVQLIDPHTTFLKPNSLVPVNDLLNQLNRESFLGTYFLNPAHPHLLCFRHRIRLSDNTRFITQDITQIYYQISEQFTRFVCKLNLIPNSPEIKSDKVQTRLVMLRHLREQFQMKRFLREKAMKHYDLTSSTIKVVDQAVKLIGYQSRLGQYYKNGNATMNSTKQKHCEQIYRTVREKLDKEAQQDKDKNKPEEIVRGIEIYEVIREISLGSGGFSMIYKGQYYASLYPTINPQLFNKDELDFEPRNKQMLVRKTIGSAQLDQISFDNELAFLKYIRSEKNSRFAGYYLPKTNIQTLDISGSHSRHIFLKFYQHNLSEAQKTMSQQHRFKICRQIIEGICFLVGKKLLHRDLKETNILVDDSGNIKLIDFGSANSIYSDNPNEGGFKAYTNDLMSTKDYFLPYSDVKASYPFVAKHYTRDQYNRAETFDNYSFGTITRNCFWLSKFGQSMLERELTYLVSKCQQTNPADRFIASEAQCYLFQIHQLFKVTSKFQEKVVGHGRNSTQQESFQ